MKNKMLGSAKRAILSRVNFAVKVRQYGKGLHIPVCAGVHCLRETERYLLPVIRELTRAGHGLFIDVGANVGQTLLKLKSISLAAPYVGVEPNPECASYLSKLIARNDFHQCEVVCCAIASAAGVAKLYGRDSVHTISSLEPESRAADVYNRSWIVPIVTGDKLVEYLDPPLGVDVIKVDVEGAEDDAILSLSATVERHRPAIIFECLPIKSEFGFWEVDSAAAAKRSEHANAIRATLDRLGYAIFQVLGDGGVRGVPDFPRLPSHEFDEINFVALDRARIGTLETLGAAA